MLSKEICEKCEHYRVLNPHHIESGRPKRFCDLGEHPLYCRPGKIFGKKV